MTVKSEEMRVLMDVPPTSFFSCELWKVREREEIETHDSFRHKSTSHISTLTQHNRQTVSPLQKLSDWGPTAGSTVIALTPEESALPSLDFNSLHLEWLIDCGGGIRWNGHVENCASQPGCNVVGFFFFKYINLTRWIDYIYTAFIACEIL